MREIDLGRGKVALVDNDDFDRVNQFKWGWQQSFNCFYARRYIVGAEKTINEMMHQFILGKPDKGYTIDHINRDGLDNRKENLRICTYSQNLMNTISHKRSSSKYKGVVRICKSYYAQITLNRKTYKLGKFTNEIDAANAYNEKAIELFGEYARLNEFTDNI